MDNFPGSVSVIPTLAHGGCVVLMQKFDALQYLQLAQTHRATHTMRVPLQYRRLMALPEFDRFDLSSFRFKFCTSAPCACWPSCRAVPSARC